MNKGVDINVTIIRSKRKTVEIQIKSREISDVCIHVNQVW